MKSVFVQCELWCEEILRRVARPSCTCSRHSASTREPCRATCPAPCPSFLPGLDIHITDCPAQRDRGPCPASPPICSQNTRRGDTTASYMFYDSSPTRLPAQQRSSRILSQFTAKESFEEPTCSKAQEESDGSYHTPPSSNKESEQKNAPFWQKRTTMFVTTNVKKESLEHVASNENRSGLTNVACFSSKFILYITTVGSN